MLNIIFVIDTLSYADHIAIACLSAVAKQKGHITHLCLLSNSDLKTLVLKIKPDVVAYSANVLSFKNIIKSHKESRSVHQFISILGGPQATFFPESFIESCVDAYCVGEGEEAFGEFLDRVENGESFDDVLNLITNKSSNPVRPLISDLDSIPALDRDLILSNSFLGNVSKKTFYATRGCPYACSYCCNNYYHDLYRHKGKIVRRFSVERVIREIEYVKKNYKTDFIKFGDDIFAIKADIWMKEFVQKYKSRIGLPFNCYLRFDIVTDELLSMLSEAGCYSVHLSVDSTSSYIREHVLNRRMRKNVNIEYNLRKIRSHNIRTWVNYMLSAPESTIRDDINTIFLSKKGKVTYTAYSITTPMNGTKLYEESLKKGYIDKNFVGDMTGGGGLTEYSSPSSLKCFSRREKNIQYNIYCLGAIAARLPYPLLYVFLAIIIMVPPNAFFLKVRNLYHKFMIERYIFKIND